VAGLLALLVGAILVLILLGSRRISKDYDIQVASVPIPTDAVSIERGRHYVETVGLCSECHGEGLGGDILSEDSVFGTLGTPNLTSGASGIGDALSDEDLVRAIRHGVGRDREALVIMPSEYFNKISDADLGAIVAYIRKLPPVDNQVPKTSLGPLGRVIALLDSSILPASKFDHTAPRPPDPTPGVTVEYGEYLLSLSRRQPVRRFGSRRAGRPSGPQSNARGCAG